MPTWTLRPRVPIFSADAAAGASAAFAAMAALHHRRRTGQGQYIEVSQSENFLPYLGEYFMDYFMNGRLSETLGNRHPYALQGCYPCLGDDKWVNISIFDDVQWQGVQPSCWDTLIGPTESQFATHHGRRSHQDASGPVTLRAMDDRTSDTPQVIMDLLQEAGVPGR